MLSARSDATSVDWKSEDSKLYHDQYRNFTAIFTGSGVLWARTAIYSSCSNFWFIDAGLSLYADKESHTEFAWKAYKVTAPYLVIIFIVST